MDTVTEMHNCSPTVAKLAAALALAQKNFAPIPKDREVTVRSDRGNYKFRYATLDAIRAATMPALAEQGIAVVQGMILHGRSPGDYAVETRLLHSSGEWVYNVTPMFVSGRVKDGRTLPPSNQELGSAQSYARRYGLSALLCITADEDDDGNAADGNHIEKSDRIRRNGHAEPEALQRVDPGDRHLVQGDGRSTYQIAHADKSAGRLAAELWASQVVGILQTPGVDILAFRDWKLQPATSKGTKNNGKKLEELREKHPDLADKIDEAASNLRVVE